MNSTRYASTVAALTGSLLCVSNVYSQDATSGDATGALAAGTDYQLIGTDQVSFGPGVRSQARKELLFKLSARGNDASGHIADAEETVWSGGIAFDRIDFLKSGEIPMYDLTEGLSYSAGVEVSSTDEFDSQSEIISSRQLGIHYGRLGSENYSSVDVGFRNYTTNGGDELVEENELWSLGVTTGRRFALTGLDSNDPLWTVSLRGQFNTTEKETIDEALDNQQWYVSPGLQWKGDSFRLTADVLMPFMQSGELEDDSDYRVRAKIQKNF